MTTKQKAYQRKWYQENKEKIKEQRSAYGKIWSQRPEVKSRRKELRDRPEAKAKAKAKRNEPTVKAQLKQWAKEWYQKPESKAKKKLYSQLPKSKAREKAYRNKSEVQIRIKAYQKTYRVAHKEKIKAYNEQYKKENKDKLKTIRNLPKNKLKEKKRSRIYHQKKEVKKMINKRDRKRRKKDEAYKIKDNIRRQLNNSLALYSTTGKTMSSKKYGVDFEAIIKHLKPFPKDIDNYHQDHIIPTSWFDHNNLKEVKWAWAPENFQWLRKELNWWKSDRFILPLSIEEQEVLMKQLKK